MTDETMLPLILIVSAQLTDHLLSPHIWFSRQVYKLGPYRQPIETSHKADLSYAQCQTKRWRAKIWAPGVNFCYWGHPSSGLAVIEHVIGVVTYIRLCRSVASRNKRLNIYKSHLSVHPSQSFIRNINLLSEQQTFDIFTIQLNVRCIKLFSNR